MASKSKYHITYQKTETYVMEDDEYTESKAWINDVVKAYTTIGKRAIKGNHENLLEAAINKRISNKKKSSNKIGYRVFDKIIGEYLVTIEDRKVIDDRLQMLGEFLDIVNKDISLTTKDPNPSKDGDNVAARSGVSPEEAIKEAILVMSYKLNKAAAFGAVMGYLANTFSDINPKEIAKTLGPMIAKETSEIKGKSRADMLKMIKMEFPNADIPEDKPKGEKDTPKEEKLTYYIGAGIYEPTDLIYEISDGSEKSIPIRDIIKKIAHDKKAQKRLNQIKPGASLWPSSASGEYYLVISNDPVLLATKSTGRSWSSTSCESHNGAYHNGPFSDIENGNAIVYIFQDNKKSDGWPNKYGATLKGRTLLRWGHRDDEVGVYDIGVEKRVYPSNKVWGLQVATAIGLILKDNGFLKYKTRCRTPYIYKGWADTMGKNGVRINYTQLMMEGQTIDLDQAIFGPEMELASSPTISYSDCNRLSRQNVDIRIRRELAQNPNIWNQEMALGRLIRSRDSMVCNLLASSPLAHPAALAAMAEQIADIDPENYRNPNSETSLIFNIARNPNSNVDVYDAIVKNHPGFINADGKEVGNAQEILYLGLYRRKNIMDGDWNKYPCLAPKERLSQLISEYLSYKATKGGNNRIKTRVHEAIRTGLVGYGVRHEGLTLALAKEIEMVNLVQNLIMAPDLQQVDYLKLINICSKMKFKALLGIEKDGVVGGVPQVLYMNYQIMLINMFSEVFCLDVSSKDAWGFNSLHVGDGREIFPKTSSIPNELRDRYANFDRQCIEAWELINTISDWDDSETGFAETYWSKSVRDIIGSNVLNGLSDGLIRDGKFTDWIWRRRAKLNIPSINFTYRCRDSVDSLKPSSYIVDGRKLNTAFEELDVKEITKFRFDFLPNAGRGIKSIRTEVASDLVNTILKKGRAELLSIGFDTVSNWLMYPKQFNLFAEITLSTAIGNYYSKDGGVIIPPYTDDELFLSPNLIEEHETNLSYLKVLNDAANGLGNVGGLCRNERIPEDIQSLITKTWADISSQYDGFYGEDYYNILEALAKNINTSPQILNDLYLENRKLHEDIASNPQTPQKLLLYLYKDYPSEVLSNSALTNANFTRLWYMTMDVLRTEVEVDIDRLNNLFRNNIDNLQAPLSGVKRREFYRKLMREQGNWLNYWRGGRVKSGGYSEFMNMNLWEDGGLADLPIPIFGKKFIMITTPNKKKDAQAETEIYFIESMTGSRDVLKIVGTVIAYNSETGNWAETKLDGRKTYTAEEFFNFISPEIRGSQEKLYFWDHSKFKTTQLIEMKQHIDKYNEDNGYELGPDEIKEGTKEPDKWDVDNIFVFTDSKPPQGEKKVPNWRYSWDITHMETIVAAFLQRMSYKEIKVLMKDWNIKYLVQGTDISNDRVAEMSLRAIYINIDKNKLWTKELIDAALPDLMYNKGEILLKLDNIPLTKKLLNATLCETDEELEEQGLSGLVTLNDLINIKMKILSYPVVPIQYVYYILETTIQPAIINMAKNIRNNRPREFNQYLIDIMPEHPEE